jgi:hypothetical protein
MKKSEGFRSEIEKFIGAVTIFFRPFLGHSVVMAWSLWVDKMRHTPHKQTPIVTVIVGIILLIVSPMGYNRGSAVGPLLALGAAYSLRVRRLSFGFIAVTCSILLLIALIFGEYRGLNLRPNEGLTTEDVFMMVRNINPQQFLQVYGGGPQFLGFLIEETGFGSKLYWGITLLASLLHPVPILGKPFRLYSGPTLYNALIYSYHSESYDQVIPFQGELFLNFHIFGVFVGFVLLGYLIAKFQRAFEMARNTFESYFLFLMALWTLFLIPGSLAVVSQIYIYFFWPIYFYAILSRVTSSEAKIGVRKCNK